MGEITIEKRDNYNIDCQSMAYEIAHLQFIYLVCIFVLQPKYFNCPSL